MREMRQWGFLVASLGAMICAPLLRAPVGDAPVVRAAALPYLTESQRQVLAAPARTRVDDRFSFSFPTGPQFTPEHKRAQCEAGKRVVPMVLEAFGAGAPSVRIPPGDYRFGPEHWGPDGVIYPDESGDGVGLDAACEMGTPALRMGFVPRDITHRRPNPEVH